MCSSDLVQKIIALDQAITKLGIANTNATLANPRFDEFSIEQLCHREVFANITQKIEITNVFEPIIVIDKLELLTVKQAAVLSRDPMFVNGNLVKRSKITLNVLLWVTDHSCCSTHQHNCLVACR